MAKENIGPPRLSSRLVASSIRVLFVEDTSNIFSPKRYYGVIPQLISGRDGPSALIGRYFGSFHFSQWCALSWGSLVNCSYRGSGLVPKTCQVLIAADR
jgi:hypothetical protein